MAKPLFQTLFCVQAVSETRFPAFTFERVTGLGKGQRRAEWRHRETGCTAVFALAPEVEGHDPAQVQRLQAWLS